MKLWESVGSRRISDSPVKSEFRLYWTGQSVSALGDQITRIGIPLIAVATLHASATEVGILSSAGSTSLLVVGLFAGALVDRFDRRRLLMGCDLGRAACIAVISGAAVLGMLSIPLLIGISFVVGALSVIFGTALVAFLPSLIPSDQLVAGNARLTQTNAVAQIAGPGVGGFLIGVLTAPVAIVLDSISYVISAMCIFRIGSDRAAPAQRPENMWRAIKGGLAFVCRHPLLRPSAGCAGTYNLFNAAIVALQVLYLSRRLGMSASTIGIVLGAIGPGALLGATLAVRVAARFGIGRTMIGGLILAGAANLAFATNTATLPVVAAMVCNGLGQPLYNINQASLRQAVVPPDMRGRVTATLSVLAGGAAPIGALAAGTCAGLLGIRTTLVAAAVGTALSSLWLLFSPIRPMVGLPHPPTAPAR